MQESGKVFWKFNNHLFDNVEERKNGKKIERQRQERQKHRDQNPQNSGLDSYWSVQIKSLGSLK